MAHRLHMPEPNDWVVVVLITLLAVAITMLTLISASKCEGSLNKEHSYLNKGGNTLIKGVINGATEKELVIFTQEQSKKKKKSKKTILCEKRGEISTEYQIYSYDKG